MSHTFNFSNTASVRVSVLNHIRCHVRYIFGLRLLYRLRVRRRFQNRRLAISFGAYPLGCDKNIILLDAALKEESFLTL
jgi:hypothetical protein